MPTEKKLIRFDWAIKSILRNKANFDVLEGFLFALLKEEITIEQLLESESNADDDQKFNRVDLLVHDKEGRRLIIEVQNQRQTDYLERLLFGTSKVIVENLPLGQSYRHILKVISISILYFNLGSGDDYVYAGKTEFKGIHTTELLTMRPRRGSKFDENPNIFPEYYLINIERFQDEIKDPLDEWIYLFKHSAIRDDFHAPNIDKAIHKLDLLQMNLEERQKYDRYIDSIVVERDKLETAEAKGIEKGRKESALAIAQQLHFRGMTVSEIAAITSLAESVISDAIT